MEKPKLVIKGTLKFSKEKGKSIIFYELVEYSRMNFNHVNQAFSYANICYDNIPEYLTFGTKYAKETCHMKSLEWIYNKIEKTNPMKLNKTFIEVNWNIYRNMCLSKKLDSNAEYWLNHHDYKSLGKSLLDYCEAIKEAYKKEILNSMPF